MRCSSEITLASAKKSPSLTAPFSVRPGQAILGTPLLLRSRADPGPSLLAAVTLEDCGRPNARLQLAAALQTGSFPSPPCEKPS